LQALCEVAGLAEGADLRASDIAYRLAPRLNAAGRLGESMVAVKLLTTKSPERALELAKRLDRLNEKRQKLERETVEKARELIRREKREDDPALVLASRNWHAGIVGIVAGRLAEQYGKPTLMVTLPKPGADADKRSQQAVGSGRSIPGFALHKALRACSDLLVGHGGHAQAAGFRLDPRNLQAFRKRFCARVTCSYPDGVPAPELVLDAEVPLSALSLGLLDDLDQLEPYGAGNRRPLFLAGGLQVLGEPRKVGQGEHHLSFQVRQGPINLKAIAWNMADRLVELMSRDGKCCLAFTPRRNEWQGKVTLDLEVSDFQPRAKARLG
jgi:single-stranded-DNA-specific exonuclease